MSISRAELRDGVRKAFEGQLAPNADKSWSTIAELGLLMTVVSEDRGGLGLGNEALGAIHIELGRALVPGPAIAQTLVIDGLATAGQADLLEAAMAGQVMTVGHFACDADRASHILVGGEGGIALVPAELAVITPQRTWDETRRLFTVETQGGGILIAEGEAARVLAEHLKKRLCLMLAADSIGGADALLALTVDYLCTRQQFGRPLAMFQALKHRCADLKAKLSAAEALFWQRASGAGTTLDQFAMLKVLATSVYRDIAEEAIQLHGGIGLTQEHPCHLFMKRAMLNCAVGGDADFWEETAGRSLLADFAE